MPKLNIDYPYWKTLVWRLVRGAVATALAQTLSLKVSWSDPEVAIKTLITSFIAGFLMALGLALRDTIESDDKSALIHKIPI